MGVVIGGDAGSVLVAAARRTEAAAALVCEGLASRAVGPQGVPAYPLAHVAEVETGTALELVAGEPATRAALREWASSRGWTVEEIRPAEVPPPKEVRVVSVSAPSTGSGKTAVARKLARTLKRSGVRTAVARHPIANLLLWEGRRAARVVKTPEELSALPGPLEEREELAPIVGAGVPAVSGVDPAEILARAAEEARVVVWDGGGSASPWVRPDLRVVVVDLFRQPPDVGREQVAEADLVVLTKADTAPAERAREVEDTVRGWGARDVTLCDMPLAVTDGRALQDRAVLIVEDWPSLALGGFKAGGGSVVARRFRTGVVDPRPHAVGALRELYERCPHIGPVVPSLGRTPDELRDLSATIRATRSEVVLWASPAAPDDVLDDDRPVVRAYAEAMEVAGTSLQEAVRPLLPGEGPLPLAGSR